MLYNMNMRLWLMKQLSSAGKATALALFFTIVRIIFVAVLHMPRLAASNALTYMIVAASCVIIGWRQQINPFIALLVGYFFIWITLVVINTPLLVAASQRSVLALLVLVLTVPIPLSLVAVIASAVGNGLYRLKRPSQYP